jgi:hypothetical protein
MDTERPQGKFQAVDQERYDGIHDVHDDGNALYEEYKHGQEGDGEIKLGDAGMAG